MKFTLPKSKARRLERVQGPGRHSSNGAELATIGKKKGLEFGEESDFHTLILESG